VTVIVGGLGQHGSWITPAMGLDVAISIGNHSAPVMGTVREVEEAVSLHVNAKVGPADAVGIHILESEHARWRGRGQIGLLEEDPECLGQPAVPKAAPAEVTVERVAPNPGIGLIVQDDCFPVGWTYVEFQVLLIIREQRIGRVQDERAIGVIVGSEKSTLDPTFVSWVRWIALPICHEPIVMVVGVHHPDKRQLSLITDALYAFGCSFRLGQGWKQHRGEDCDDGDHNEQFDKGKRVRL